MRRQRLSILASGTTILSMWHRALGVLVVSIIVLGPMLFMSSLEASSDGFSDAQSDGVDQAAAALAALTPLVLTPQRPGTAVVGRLVSSQARFVPDVAPPTRTTRAPPGSQTPLFV